MRILLVEDTAALRNMLAAHLRAQRMVVDAAEDGATALRLAEAAPDALILDLGLPDIDGIELLRQLRLGPLAATPCLILTARDAVRSRVAGLDAGADDYLVKPFDLDELDARLRAILRRPGLRQAQEYVWRDLRFDSTRILRRDTAAVELTPREAAVFETLLRAAETIVIRDTLAEKLGAEDVSANALEAIVSRLRKKLETIGGAWRIETVRGIGYRLGGG